MVCSSIASCIVTSVKLPYRVRLFAYYVRAFLLHYLVLSRYVSYSCKILVSFHNLRCCFIHLPQSTLLLPWLSKWIEMHSAFLFYSFSSPSVLFRWAPFLLPDIVRLNLSPDNLFRLLRFSLIDNIHISLRYRAIVTLPLTAEVPVLVVKYVRSSPYALLNLILCLHDVDVTDHCYISVYVR